MRPCPFCGCRDLFVNKSVRYNATTIWANGHVICTGCGSTGPKISVRKETGYEESLQKLIEGAWNFSGKVEQTDNGSGGSKDGRGLREAE